MASNYFSNWKSKQYQSIIDTLGLKDFSCQGSPHLIVDICVAYWRKSNQIHNWFVTNCQNGVDECQESEVTREQLEELLSVCEQALTNKDSKMLPPTDGFFFGSTDIDDGYWDDIEYTITQLKAILKNPGLKAYSFKYRASW